MADIEQATSPVIRQPTTLGPDALKEADDDLLRLLATAPSRPTARRGRPPGSKNKPKAAGIVGAGRPEPKRGDDKANPEEVLRAKKAKTEEYTARIVQEINDQLLTVLVSMGVPPSLLYIDGKGPAAKQFRTDLTPIGSGVAIQPSQARAVASFLTELEFTDTGSKIAQSVGSGNGALVLKGLLALAASVQYLQGLNKFRSQLQPLLEAYQQAQQAANGQQPKPPPTPGEQMRTKGVVG